MGFGTLADWILVWWLLVGCVRSAAWVRDSDFGVLPAFLLIPVFPVEWAVSLAIPQGMLAFAAMAKDMNDDDSVWVITEPDGDNAEEDNK